MSQVAELPRITIEDYLEGELSSPIRHEYLAGQVYAMAGASERHNRIAGNLFFQLRAAARGGSCGVFMSDMKIRVRGGERFYYPDVALVCDATDQAEYYKDNPCLIAEVLSPATETTDRREKWLAYQDLPALRYYLLVNAVRPEIDYYQRSAEGGWLVGRLEPGETLEVECDGYRAALRFEDIFEDVRWPASD
ncbi:MAG: Uma2 family endonuclease [Candidatus Competibacteraceae bacterium]|jgi:Uma2 family endonuclease|nr:Uma2 family endonuclease [Candidatus Competibacteraceae bacterium]